MTPIEHIREAIEALAYRSPVLLMTAKRFRTLERNAFTLGVEYGTYNATKKVSA